MWLVMGALEGKRFARPLAETLGRMQNSTVWLHQLYRGTGKVLKSLIGTGPGLKGVHIPTMRHSSVGKVEPLKRERPAKGGVPTNKLTSHQQDGLSCCRWTKKDSNEYELHHRWRQHVWGRGLPQQREHTLVYGGVVWNPPVQVL